MRVDTSVQIRELLAYMYILYVYSNGKSITKVGQNDHFVYCIVRKEWPSECDFSVVIYRLLFYC